MALELLLIILILYSPSSRGIDKCVPSLAISAISISKLIFMQVPSFDWTSGQFMAHTFTRSWMELFTKSNDTFGAQLIDKVWAYSNGKTSDLEIKED